MSEEKIPLSSNSSSGGPENNTSNNVNAPKIEIKGISKNKPIILKGKKKDIELSHPLVFGTWSWGDKNTWVRKRVLKHICFFFLLSL